MHSVWKQCGQYCKCGVTTDNILKFCSLRTWCAWWSCNLFLRLGLRGSMELRAALWRQLPFEILDQVLSFLPAPDLCRYRSVCKRWNGLICSPKFGALHAQNAAKREASFIVMMCTHRVNEETHEECCILDLNSRRWYAFNVDRYRHREPEHDFHDVMAMDGGLVCQYSNVSNYLSIIVHNPIGYKSKKLPYVRYCNWTSGSLPMLNMVVDTISRNFKIFHLDHNFDLKPIMELSRASTRDRLLNLVTPLMRVYDSATNEWQCSTNPSCVSSGRIGFVGNAYKVMFHGLLYVILGSSDEEERHPLWRYNLVEDVWENVAVHIPSRLRSPQLIVSANRLFLVAWYPLKPDGVLNKIEDRVWILEVSEFKVPDMTRETLIELAKADIVRRLDVRTGIEKEHEFPTMSVFGFGSSLMFMSNSSGKSMAFDLVTRNWDCEWPQKPSGHLRCSWVDRCLWVGKHMNLLLPSAPL